MAVDKELVQGINLMIQGKEEGFNVLYSKTYNYVYGRAKILMKDEQDALDLTQEAFIQAYKHIDTLENVNNIYAWLGGIVYRHGMKIFRKKRDLLVNEDAEGIFEDIVSEDKDFHPEENAQLKATSNIIMSMIEELPELQKAAILAFYYDNMKIDDIAEAFECSSNTIKSRLNYAKKFLKEKVEAHERAYSYKLHSLSPAVIILAFRTLLSGESYTMSAATAQSVYNFACAGCGFAPTAIAVSASSATVASGTATTTAATTTATAATAATATATKAGMALGTKLLIGLATVATVGTVAVGAATVVNNNGGFEELFGNLFAQETESEVDDEEKDSETETLTDDTENSEEDITPTYESYSEVVTEMSTGKYSVINSSYDNVVRLMSDAIITRKFIGIGSSFDTSSLSAAQKASLDYSILNGNNFTGNYRPETVDVEIEGVNYGEKYELSVLDAYFAAFYEGGSLQSYYNAIVIYDDYVVVNFADGDTTYDFSSYAISEMDEYILFEAPCFELDHDGTQTYVYDVKLLFKKIEEGPFGVQFVRAETTVKTIEVESITASSALAGSGGKTYGTENLVDGDIKTAWVEGVNGLGIGSTIEINLGSVQKVSSVSIISGYMGSYYLYDINGKVTSVSIDFGNGVVVESALTIDEFYSTSKTDVEYCTTNLVSTDTPVWTDKIIITITGAQAGSAYEDVCISEIEVH